MHGARASAITQTVGNVRLGQVEIKDTPQPDIVGLFSFFPPESISLAGPSLLSARCNEHDRDHG